jgi:hypothetical protein
MKVVIILFVIVAALGVYAAFQIMPLSWDHARFEQLAKGAMMTALVPPYTNVEETVKKQIAALLDNMHATYQPEYIKVTVSEDFKKIQAEVWYSRSHGLPFYQNPKQFYSKLEHASLLPKINLPKPPTETPVD